MILPGGRSSLADHTKGYQGTKLKILYVVPYVPDPIRVRPYQLIRGLSSRGHSVSVATLWTSEWERQSLKALEAEDIDIHALHLPTWRSIWNCMKAIPSRDPLQAVYCWHPQMKRLLSGLAAQTKRGSGFDLIHIEHLRGAMYGLWLKDWLATQGQSIPIVWDSVDSISLLFRLAARKSLSLPRRLVTAFELPRTERFEARIIDKFPQVLATSGADANALRELSGGGLKQEQIKVLPNGVDLQYFHPRSMVERSPKRLVMTGKMSYHANISMVLHFVEEILPGIQALHPEVELWIVGKDPSREVQALSTREGIFITGTVEDIRPFLWEATLAVAPLTYAAGIQNKVLEAMASGTPVVVSEEAAKSLQIADGQEARIAADPAAFGRAVVDLLDDPDGRARLSTAGRAYVERHHDWTQISEQLETIYDGLIKTNNEQSHYRSAHR